MSGHRRIDVHEAEALIAQHMPLRATAAVAANHAAGRVLREPLNAERDQPPFDRVTMDGIAIDHRAIETGRREFHIQGTQGAGAPAMILAGSDHCIEIMTGASLPVGADTVIPVERIAVADGKALLEPEYEPAPNQFIHQRGSDHRAGSLLLSPGCIIGPAEAAAVTICGQAEIAVSDLPRIAVISTGDELVEVGEPISDVQIRSSNGPALQASLQRHGHGTATEVRLPDDPQSLLCEIRQLHDIHDVLILSGGVSMGKFDYVPKILDELGVTLIFHKILQRPGLPMWFGLSAAAVPIFALPGNPVSSLVCMTRYVLPALDRAAGCVQRDTCRIALAETIEFRPDLTCFMPVVLLPGDDGIALAHPRPTNTSGDFASLAGTDGLIELPRGYDRFEAGFVANYFAW